MSSFIHPSRPQPEAVLTLPLRQVAAHAPSGLACGTLLIVSELLKARAALWSAVLQPEDHDDNEEVFRDDPADKLLRSTRGGEGDGHGSDEDEDEGQAAAKGGGYMRGAVIDTGTNIPFTWKGFRRGL